MNRPVVFLCHASEDEDLAERIAHALMASGIETFFSPWSIRPGDSLRQKIDEGLHACTHFLVLLTPRSLAKPWVTAEIDAGFVKKVSGEARFIPIRHGVAPSDMPPLLQPLLSPKVEGSTFRQDINSLMATFTTTRASHRSGRCRASSDPDEGSSGSPLRLSPSPCC